jgi:hypothetical protein
MLESIMHSSPYILSAFQDLPPNGKHHPPAGLQRILPLRAIHYNEPNFELAARLAGRVHAVCAIRLPETGVIRGMGSKDRMIFDN